MVLPWYSHQISVFTKSLMNRRGRQRRAFPAPMDAGRASAFITIYCTCKLSVPEPEPEPVPVPVVSVLFVVVSVGVVVELFVPLVVVSVPVVPVLVSLPVVDSGVSQATMEKASNAIKRMLFIRNAFELKNC